MKFLNKYKEKYKKRYLLNEMSLVGVVSKVKNLEVWVYHEPLGNPSFHLKGKDYEVVLSIKNLIILEWKKQPANNIIPLKDRKSLLDWFSKQNHKDPDSTNWKIIKVAWNLNNSKSIHYSMPDYDIDKSFLNKNKCR